MNNDSTVIRALAASLLLAFLSGASATAAVPAKRATFQVLQEHYAAIWRALSDDRLDGIEKEALAMEKATRKLMADFDAERAGVPEDETGIVREALPELAEASAKLARARGIAAARDAFHAVSKPMVRYRSAVSEPGTVVVYCPMAERGWIQGGGPVANPYYGKSMLRCGTVLPR